jgi:predicted DsbA family dithiol-disulfide isomerase
MTVIEIDIVFDFICAVSSNPFPSTPLTQTQWCYIGKRSLDRAIALYRKTYPGGRNDTITVKWRPFYLNPNKHGRSVPKSVLFDERLKDKTPEQRTAMVKRLDKIAQSVGVRINYGGMIGPDTRDAHRLVYLSREDPTISSEVHGELVEKLLEAYHEREMDISRPEVLREAAVAAGIEDAVVERWLAEDVGNVVDEEAMKNREIEGIRGVPRFLFQGKYVWDGEDLQEFMEIMGKVKAEEGSKGGP